MTEPSRSFRQTAENEIRNSRSSETAEHDNDPGPMPHGVTRGIHHLERVPRHKIVVDISKLNLRADDEAAEVFLRKITDVTKAHKRPTWTGAAVEVIADMLQRDQCMHKRPVTVRDTVYTFEPAL
jgi:hypothetical protein